MICINFHLMLFADHRNNTCTTNLTNRWVGEICSTCVIDGGWVVVGVQSFGHEYL